MTIKRGIVVGMCVLAPAVIAFRAVHSSAALQVTTAAVTRGPIVRQILTTGTLQPAENVEVGAQVTGIVQSLGADFNAIVHRGEVLARLDPATFQAALDSANAQMSQARADLENARAAEADTRTKLERAQALHREALLDDSDLNDAQVAYDTAVGNVKALAAQVTVAQAAVDAASVNLRHTIITSPIDGIVTARDVDVGQTVSASFQAPVLFVVANDLTQLQLQASVDEADIGSVRAGANASFTVDAYPGETFHGDVEEVRLDPVDQSGANLALSSAASTPSPTPASSPTSAAAASGTPPAGTVVLYTAIVDVNNPDEKLRPGMTAIISLMGPHVDAAIRIPNNALAYKPSLTTAAVEHPSGDPHVQEVWKYEGRKLVPIVVTTGLSDDSWTELKNGSVAPGDLLVTGAPTK